MSNKPTDNVISPEQLGPVGNSPTTISPARLNLLHALSCLCAECEEMRFRQATISPTVFLSPLPTAEQPRITGIQGNSQATKAQEHIPTLPDITILHDLDKHGRALRYVDIVQEAAKLVKELGGRTARESGLILVSESVVRERVPILSRAGLVARPPNANGKPSQRKGVGITPAGRQSVARYRPAPAR